MRFLLLISLTAALGHAPVPAKPFTNMLPPQSNSRDIVASFTRQIDGGTRWEHVVRFRDGTTRRFIFSTELRCP